MSHIIYGENKILGYFTLDPEFIREDVDKLLSPIQLVIFVHHVHYSVIYLERLFIHFKPYLKQGVTKNNLRICIEGKEVPLDLPIGLYFTTSNRFLVIVSELQCPDGFKIIKNNWKKAFTIINLDKGCDHIKNWLKQHQQKQKYELYCSGKTHNFQSKDAGYEGKMIVIKFCYKGDVVERKALAKTDTSIREFIEEEFKQLKISQTNISMQSHGQPINTEMSLKEFLDQWSYNDGYCYIKFS